MYQQMADQYFNMAKEVKPALTAARKCFVIAAENAQAILGLYKLNDDSDIKRQLT